MLWYNSLPVTVNAACYILVCFSADMTLFPYILQTVYRVNVAGMPNGVINPNLNPPKSSTVQYM